MIPRVDTKQFQKDMNNILDYAVGFLDGIQNGKSKFFANFGEQAVDVTKTFIDSNARANPSALHHIYEWYQTGSPNARLFELNYTVSNLGLSIKSTFSQSQSIKEGSKQPFYDKARIMENGLSVKISPKESSVLAFEDNGEIIFSRSDITVSDPGGKSVQGSFERVFDTFMKNYFKQSFLKSSGIMDYLENPYVFKSNMKKGKQLGRSAGLTTGYRWIANAGAQNGQY